MGECFLVRRGGNGGNGGNKFNSAESIISATGYTPSMATTFLTTLDLSSFDTSKVTNMSYMFTNFKKITTLDLSSFDTSKVTNMSYMFGNCSSLTTLDLSSFDTSMVPAVKYMFYGCENLTTVYCKDVLDKAIFAASSGCPSTVTFVVGKPS